MARIKETVDPKLVMHFVKRANPDMSNCQIAECLSLDRKRIYDLLKGKNMLFDTADRILSKMGLNYLLITGDIPITTTVVKDDRVRYGRKKKKVSS